MDRYGRDSVAIIVTTLVLSFADAFLTLNLIRLGAEELNPLMLFFLKLGPIPFLLAKYFLTASGVTALIVLKNYPLLGGAITVGRILLIAPALYLVLVAYEIATLARVHW